MVGAVHAEQTRALRPGQHREVGVGKVDDAIGGLVGQVDAHRHIAHCDRHIGHADQTRRSRLGFQRNAGGILPVDHHGKAHQALLAGGQHALAVGHDRHTVPVVALGAGYHTPILAAVAGDPNRPALALRCGHQGLAIIGAGQRGPLTPAQHLAPVPHIGIGACEIDTAIVGRRHQHLALATGRHRAPIGVVRQAPVDRSAALRAGPVSGGQALVAGQIDQVQAPRRRTIGRAARSHQHAAAFVKRRHRRPLGVGHAAKACLVSPGVPDLLTTHGGVVAQVHTAVQRGIGLGTGLHHAALGRAHRHFEWVGLAIGDAAQVNQPISRPVADIGQCAGGGRVLDRGLDQVRQFGGQVLEHLRAAGGAALAVTFGGQVVADHGVDQIGLGDALERDLVASRPGALQLEGVDLRHPRCSSLRALEHASEIGVEAHLHSSESFATRRERDVAFAAARNDSGARRSIDRCAQLGSDVLPVSGDDGLR